MIATSGFLAALECTKFVFDRALDLTDPLAGLKGPGLLLREGKEGYARGGEGREADKGEGVEK